MSDHCICLGDHAGCDFPHDASYLFELRVGNIILRKQMDPEEFEFLTNFIQSCDNNMGIMGTTLTFTREHER